ncbi:MAG TPA: hypothetical protein VKR06_31445 [Ktedonosporobacter sp.]|nr:hypothetical protein [Ktedonosporobacter sp.]
MSQIVTRKRLSQLRFLPIGIIVLAVLTAVVHLVLALGTFWVLSHGPAPAGSSPGGLLTMATLFLLNFVGYLVLVVALYMPWLQRSQRLIRWLLIGYTVLTIVLWYFIEASHADMFDYTDKLIEVGLIALLLIEGWQNRQRTA